jgi:hypothetical protein
MLLESDSPKDEAKPFRMARDVYKSCMDKEAIEALGIQPIKDILKQFGGWPGQQNWHEFIMTHLNDTQNKDTVKLG